jgi:Family of unknown function (DUF1028)
MTWSIIARDERTGRIAIAVATRYFAAGALVTHIKTGAGAVASQAFINPYFGSKGLAIAADLSPKEVPLLSYQYSFEDLLALLHGRAPAKVDAVALHRRRVEHGHLSVGLKIHCLGGGRRCRAHRLSTFERCWLGGATGLAQRTGDTRDLFALRSPGSVSPLCQNCTRLFYGD